MIEVLAPGPYASLQDLGRPGYRSLGVAGSGAADLGAHRLANRLVGNADSAATVEITLGGLAIRLLDAATIAFTGARCPQPLSWNAALSLPAGTVLRLGTPATGVRSYLAIRGGVAVPPVLGSRSTDTLSGLGPAPLRTGDLLPVGTGVTGAPADPAIGQDASPAADLIPLRALLGPRADWFDADAPGLLFGTSWSVSPACNRIGIRLDGPPLRRVRAGELPTEAALPGAVQVPPDGRPILFGPDAPVTGGYPVLAVLLGSELDRLAQLRPGARVRLADAATRSSSS
ncbi:MAG: biotin-dependent carboxyltransferase family protein [Jatrophihabitans sp.]